MTVIRSIIIYIDSIRNKMFADSASIDSVLKDKKKRFKSGVLIVYENEKIKAVSRIDNAFWKYSVILSDGSEKYVPRFSKIARKLDKYKPFF